MGITQKNNSGDMHDAANGPDDLADLGCFEGAGPGDFDEYAYYDIGHAQFSSKDYGLSADLQIFGIYKE